LGVIIKNINFTDLQYFSKTKKEWVNFKHTDCEENLKKYGYEVRINPRYACRNCKHYFDPTVDTLRCDYFRDDDICCYYEFKNKIPKPYWWKMTGFTPFYFL
jgi:hypothetical protein